MSRCIVLLKIGANAQHGYARVSVIDYYYLKSLGWILSKAKAGYPRFQNFHGTNIPEYLHRLIFLRMFGQFPEKGKVVDHRNGDKYDNTRDNVRPATYKQNSTNRRRGCNNKSGYKGVSFSKEKQRWVARINTGTSYKSLGYFPTKELAHAAYLDAAAKYHGEFINDR